MTDHEQHEVLHRIDALENLEERCQFVLQARLDTQMAPPVVAPPGSPDDRTLQ